MPYDRTAEAYLRRKQDVPTDLTSREMAELGYQIRERAFWSATVNNAKVVNAMHRACNGFAAGKLSMSDARLAIQRALDSAGYKPADGTRGTIRDLSSFRRQDLILRTNLEMAQGYARLAEAQEDLDLYPCFELVRIRQSRVPRDWKSRWVSAGGRLYGGRMIALKSSPVWKNLSRFDRPYPPFDFGSGMGVEDIDRDEAIALGLLPKDEPVDEIPDFDDALETEVSLERIPEDLVAEIAEKTPNCEIRGDKLVMRTKPKLPTWEDLKLPDVRKWEKPETKFFKPKAESVKTVEADARRSLQEGESVQTPIGEIEFNEYIYKDWVKYADTHGKNSAQSDRLLYLDLAKKMASTAREVWRQGNQTTFINIYENERGQTRGLVVVVENNMVVKTYFAKDAGSLNKARKGELVWKQ